ncbi:aldehyde dehydrogenase family protein [Nocardioides daeguensis]|uniref:Aldehyde dehydrogenase n=1 Tax=Nocardioides daeguensis TaxID=908359 RepID=A0ABP6VKG6_9ACTN|nr:aldehyde dehydrogenase family protein [Nocardioides daeguensis]MBV6728888.1 aldehyde dehydrogenase family protein [Nocardioides daeguensis]MCR1773409.1 aldehyde dehydrogenase family protein [Nocardioides daeguensis]
MTTIAVENPATGRVIGTVPDLSADHVADAARRARAAQPAWAALGFDGRAQVLRRMQRWIVDHTDELIATICAETGKTYEDALLAEVSYGAAAFGFWAKQAPRYLAETRIRSSQPLVAGKRLVQRYRPLGLVGVIGPWNYPLTNSFGDCIPALAAGNAVLLKPSEITPLTSLLLAEGLAACGLPDGVFGVVTGRGETGAALVDEVDMVMFTGSTATGRRVAARAAERLIPASLELGGKDPMIVLADADLERAATHAAYYAMFNCGQTCISIERCYVEEPVYAEFVELVSAKVDALRQGVPQGPGSVDVGSLTFPPQVDVIDRHVSEALAAGAQALTGGVRPERPGYWYPPTVLVDVDHSMAIMREETFGPTLPIMAVRDADEAVRLANDSEYGLCASVFGRDLARAEDVARRLEAGAVTVNDAVVNYTALELPMGGAKPASGIGRRHGREGIVKYCRQQSLLVSRWHLRHDVHTYPYRAARSRFLARVLGVLNRGRRTT